MRWDDILSGVLMEHGIWAMLFIAALVVAHIWIARLHKGRLDDRQREIDRLAEDNRAYRELFVGLLHDKVGLTKEDG